MSRTWLESHSFSGCVQYLERPLTPLVSQFAGVQIPWHLECLCSLFSVWSWASFSFFDPQVLCWGKRDNEPIPESIVDWAEWNNAGDVGSISAGFLSISFLFPCTSSPRHSAAPHFCNEGPVLYLPGPRDFEKCFLLCYLTLTATRLVLTS